MSTPGSQFAGFALVRSDSSPAGAGAPFPGSPASNAGSVFSRLSCAATNPDWKLSFTQSQSAAARSVAVDPAPPAPVDALVSSMSAAPPRAASRLGFLSTLVPPKALNTGKDVPVPLGILPVDACLTMGTAAPPATARRLHTEVRLPQPIGGFQGTLSATPAPLALGSDTWNALSGLNHIAKAALHRPVAPLSIDAAVRPLLAPAAPKPLWSDMTFHSSALTTAQAMGTSAAAAMHPMEAPTLEAFRYVAPVVTSAAASAAALVRPVPPKPITTSPLREASPVKAHLPAAAASALERAPLIPVGEEAQERRPAHAALQALSRVLSPEQQQQQQQVPPALVGLPRQDSGAALESPPTLPAEFSRTVVQPSSTNRREVQKAANFKLFLSSLFSRDEVAAPALQFDALDAMTGKGHESTQQPSELSTLFEKNVFEDLDEEEDYGMEHLRVIVNIVKEASMQDGTSTPSGGSNQGGSAGGSSLFMGLSSDLNSPAGNWGAAIH